MRGYPLMAPEAFAGIGSFLSDLVVVQDLMQFACLGGRGRGDGIIVDMCTYRVCRTRTRLSKAIGISTHAFCTRPSKGERGFFVKW